MLLPSIFNDSIYDELMNLSFPTQSHPARGERSAAIMRTDVREAEGFYEMDVDLPGFSKDDVKLSLKNGYLSIAATRNTEHEEKEGERFIRRERHYGSFARSFYVGNGLIEEDIKASFENGTLHITLPSESRKKLEETTYIPIAG